MNQVFYPNGDVDEVLQLIAGPKFGSLNDALDFLRGMYDPDVSVQSSDVDGLWIQNFKGDRIAVVKWDGR